MLICSNSNLIQKSQFTLSYAWARSDFIAAVGSFCVLIECMSSWAVPMALWIRLLERNLNCSSEIALDNITFSQFTTALNTSVLTKLNKGTGVNSLKEAGPWLLGIGAAKLWHPSFRPSATKNGGWGILLFSYWTAIQRCTYSIPFSFKPPTSKE